MSRSTRLQSKEKVTKPKKTNTTSNHKFSCGGFKSDAGEAGEAGQAGDVMGQVGFL